MRRTLVAGWMICAVCLALCRAQAAKSEEQEKNAPSKTTSHQSAKKPVVACFTIKGEYPEGPVAPGLFSEMRPSLAKIIERLDAAAADKTVAAAWLRIEPFAMGRGKLNELRAAVRRIRAAGKPVYAELSAAEASQYLLAGACDEIIMPPSGMLIMPGLRAEVTFYKGLLDKLGIEFDLLQMGKYKGAAEPLTRTNMSPPLRESLEALVDDLYNDLAAVVASDRKMKDYQVKTLLDQGLFTAPAAQKAGLIDQVVYADQFQDTLRNRLKSDEIDVVKNYKKKKIDADFSGMTGMIKLMELFFGGKPAKPLGKKNKIAVVYAVGPIMQGKSDSDLFGESVVGSTTLVEALQEAEKDATVVAIVLRVDSPGGSALASDLIWRETVRIKKPVIASMGDVAASGGYYIAMGARRIIAEPGTITGSIGVVGGKVVVRGLWDKLGLSTEVISRGQRSGMFSPTQPFTPDERKVCTGLMHEIYQQFVSKAAQGRKVPPKDLEKLAQGRVYTGRMAKANGLVDELGTLKDAIVAAKKAAGLKADEEVDLLVLPEPKTFFEQLFGDPSASSELKQVPPELTETIRQSRLWRRLFGEPALLWLPYKVQVR